MNANSTAQEYDRYTVIFRPFRRLDRRHSMVKPGRPRKSLRRAAGAAPINQDMPTRRSTAAASVLRDR